MAKWAWKVTIAWGSAGKDLDIYTTLTAAGRTTSGVGWSNGSRSTSITVNQGGVNGTFFLVWGGDNTSYGGSETVTVVFDGTLPAGHTQVATLTPHCNFYGAGSGQVSITVDNQSGTYHVTASTNYGNRATASSTWINVPLYADGGGSAKIYEVSTSIDPAAPTVGGSTAGQGLYDYGETCTLVATPATGFAFRWWLYDGEIVSTSSTYSFSVVSDVHFVAVFETSSGGGGTGSAFTISASAKDYTVNGNTVTYGKIQINDRPPATSDTAYFLPQGDTVVLTAIPNAGYEFLRWERKYPAPTYKTSRNPFPFPAQRHETWTAVFGVKITTEASPADGGETTVTPVGTAASAVVEPGEAYSVTATPKFRHTFLRWSDGTNNYTINPLTIQNAQTAKTWTAYFKRNFTDLLVNTANVGYPVRLVYDDINGTGLLVADY